MGKKANISITPDKTQYAPRVVSLALEVKDEAAIRGVDIPFTTLKWSAPDNSNLFTYTP
jgi:hypothetical protein